MKEALFNIDAGEDTVSIVDSPIPKPNATQVLIKVEAAGMNPKDFKHKGHGAHNQGDDIAGVVESVGENVTEFKKGDRVAAFHEMGDKAGAYAEYAIAWAHTTFHIPKKTSFEGELILSVPIEPNNKLILLVNQQRQLQSLSPQ